MIDLPAELIHMIFMRLNIRDATQLRLTCRWFARFETVFDNLYDYNATEDVMAKLLVPQIRLPRLVDMDVVKIFEEEARVEYSKKRVIYNCNPQIYREGVSCLRICHPDELLFNRFSCDMFNADMGPDSDDD